MNHLNNVSSDFVPKYVVRFSRRHFHNLWSFLPGYYCPTGQNMSSPFPCQPGYFCVRGSFTMEACPSGTYQDESAKGACKECLAGKVNVIVFHLFLTHSTPDLSWRHHLQTFSNWLNPRLEQTTSSADIFEQIEPQTWADDIISRHDPHLQLP
jgi:hypothetical protein